MIIEYGSVQKYDVLRFEGNKNVKYIWHNVNIVWQNKNDKFTLQYCPNGSKTLVFTIYTNNKTVLLI